MTASFIFSLIVLVLTIVALMQIITKAGYSTWWVLVPLSLPVLWLITWAVLLNDFSNALSGPFGGFGIFSFTSSGTLRVLIDLFEVDMVLNFVMFLVFAFSEWPVVRAARGRVPVGPSGGAPRGGPSGTSLGRPNPGAGGTGGAGGGAVGSVPGAPGAPGASGQDRPAGWFTSGPMGAGEQSYWDGSAWTARRRWQKGAWVDLPLEQTAPSGTAEE